MSTELAKIDVGMCNVFSALFACSLNRKPLSLGSVQHTSASLVLNENADPDVRADLEKWCNLSVPEGPSAPWQHTDEGHDDMPAREGRRIWLVSDCTPHRRAACTGVTERRNAYRGRHTADM